ncbi:hypothetical protein SacmaDRAFT_2610 [Saccharomonospora marina XMU15]|uniref:Transmembrane protein n=2 Tax=Saccharomonospora TaxID=1851 RepID=H5X0Q6_9PSEU|nr:hypothetical protein SacmaDRAFT_2610 [Saccharomonospora marina XMU15]
MSSTAAAITGAVVFGWLGMVVGISFIEAPLKFRAPGITIPLGLGIGRLVFRALNTVEAVLAVTALLAVFLGGAPAAVLGLTIAVAAILLVQVALVRPPLSRRTDRALAGEELPRSRAHFGYVGLEVGKVVCLLILGVLVVSL